MADVLVRQQRAMTQAEVAFCERSIPDAFAEVAAGDPGALALGGEVPVTYAELAAGVDRVACGLLERLGEGVEPVGLLFDGTRGWIESLLGVLKAGKIAMPLDVSAPRARLAACVSDSGARLILGDVPSSSAGDVTSLGSLAGYGSAPVGSDAGGDSPSMLIYTSGSTGEPKGILTRQATEVHLALTYREVVNVGRDSQVALLLSPAFAAAYSVTLATLLCGATLLRYRADQQGLSALPGWMAACDISVTTLVSSMVRGVAAAAGARGLRSIRTLSIAGESLSASHLELARWMLPPDARVLYGYGATETGAICRNVIDDRSYIDGVSVPVGFAEMGKTVRITDVEDGVGEIVVTSRYLSHGYWKREAETALAFSDESGGERSYRTGDLGRVDEQGRLAIVGRRDRRIKIAGKRVELDAIEHALLEHDDVREAVVVARQRSTGSSMLVGFVTPRSGTVDIPAVKGSLVRTLPRYMVPGRLVTLEALPRLQSGKVDRGALAAKAAGPGISRNPSAAPRSC